MEQAFQPDKAAGQSAVVQWDVDAPDGTHSRTVHIADGSCKVEPGATASPPVKVGEVDATADEATGLDLGLAGIDGRQVWPGDGKEAPSLPGFRSIVTTENGRVILPARC